MQKSHKKIPLVLFFFSLFAQYIMSFSIFCRGLRADTEGLSSVQGLSPLMPLLIHSIYHYLFFRKRNNLHDDSQLHALHISILSLIPYKSLFFIPPFVKISLRVFWIAQSVFPFSQIYCLLFLTLVLKLGYILDPLQSFLNLSCSLKNFCFHLNLLLTLFNGQYNTVIHTVIQSLHCASRPLASCVTMCNLCKLWLIPLL